MKAKSHALVVGGTGMLSKATCLLFERYETVSVVARNKAGFQDLSVCVASGHRLNPLMLDYRDSKIFSDALLQAVKEFGPIELAIVWIHDAAPDAPKALAEVLNDQGMPCRYFHVKGSTKDLAKLRSKNPFVGLENIHYKQIILGAIGTSKSWRWLKNDEISAGVIAAVESDAAVFVVGDLLV